MTTQFDQSSPVHTVSESRGVPWAWQKKDKRETLCLILDSGLKNFNSFWKIFHGSLTARKKQQPNSPLLLLLGHYGVCVLAIIHQGQQFPSLHWILQQQFSWYYKSLQKWGTQETLCFSNIFRSSGMWLIKANVLSIFLHFAAPPLLVLFFIAHHYTAI